MARAYSDKEQLKQHLERYLKLHGVKFEPSGKFLCPFHNDEDPSMSIVPGSNGAAAKCFACGASGDIFTFAAHFYGLENKTDFIEIKKRVASELGQTLRDEPREKTKTEKTSEAPVTLSSEAAKAVYTPQAIIDLGKFVFADAMAVGAELKIEAAWPCKNEAGDVEFIEVRFHSSCFANGKKRPCAVWWNGARLKSKNNPHGLFGRELLSQYPEKPALIVEGPKCQEAAKALGDFVPVAWNGGGNGQKKINFSPLRGRRVYIWPDDDEAGEKSSRQTAKLLQGVAKEIIIVRPMPEAREIKPEKADIVEALQVKAPDEITRYILSHTPLEEKPKSNDPYIAAGIFLAEKGFFKVYDRKAVGFYSVHEEQPYHYGEIRDKFAEDKISGLNPAKAAKMICNLDPAYPVYHLVKSYGLLPRYIGYDKGRGEFVINRWRGFAYPLKNPLAEDAGIEGQVELVKSHIKDIICGGDSDSYEYTCNWVAHMLQKPDIKPGVAILVQTEKQGSGKSIIFEQLIPNIIGVNLISVFSNSDQIKEKFNSWIFESLYAVFSEQTFYENTENIKSWITEKHHSRRGMGVESTIENSYLRIVICTNNESAVRLEKSDRRFFIPDVSEKMIGNRDYFTKLAAAVNSLAVLDRMARFFFSIDISNFNPFDFPKSQKRQMLIDIQKHPVIDFFENVIYRQRPKCELLLCSEVDPEGNNFYNSKKLYEEIKDFGSSYKGMLFIERDRLYEYWRNNEGRSRRESSSGFTRIINRQYDLKENNFKPDDKIMVMKHRVKESGKVLWAYIYLIKGEIYE